MNNEIKNLEAQLRLAQKSFSASAEIADYESAHMLAERLQLITRQLLLCQKQVVEEAE